MASQPIKGTRITVDLPDEMYRRVKAQADLEEMTITEWVLGLVMDELEEEEDVRVALERLHDLEGSVSLEELHRQRMQRGEASDL